MIGDNLGTIVSVAAGIGTVISAILTFVYVRLTRGLHRAATAEATARVFDEWWSEPFARARQHLRTVRGVPADGSMRFQTVLQDVLTKDESDSVRMLCGFFDRLGWLCAGGLVSADVLLPPMQHMSRYLWLVFGSSIQASREALPTEVNAETISWSPLLYDGVEWLYRRSERRHQSVLLYRAFLRPGLYRFPPRQRLTVLAAAANSRSREAWRRLGFGRARTVFDLRAAVAGQEEAIVKRARSTRGELALRPPVPGARAELLRPVRIAGRDTQWVDVGPPGAAALRALDIRITASAREPQRSDVFLLREIHTEMTGGSHSIVVELQRGQYAPARQDPPRRLDLGAQSQSFPSGGAVGTNICAITADDLLLIARRSDSCATYAGQWTTSVGETLDTAHDVSDGKPDPVASACRGAMEELGVSVTRDSVDILAFGIGMDYGDASFLGIMRVPLTADRLAAFAAASRDWSVENDALRWVPWTAEAVANLLLEGGWVPAAQAAILHAAQRDFSLAALASALFMLSDE
jgi:hypothetical protein